MSPDNRMGKACKNFQLHDEKVKDNKIYQSELDLRSKDLTVFPISELTNCRAFLLVLNLNFNSISTLPLGLSKQLPLLQTFLLDGNELSSIPEEIGDMHYLQELSICENKLLSLPESLCKLTQLHVLKVNSNSLKRLYSEIGQNSLLEVLCADENKLKHLPATLGMLCNLQVLEINNNKLETLPATLNYLQSLRSVDLSNNRLTHIPETFGHLPNLKQLDLSENRIQSLCMKFSSASTLEKLHLNLNFFSKCPQWFNDLENIIEITMASNDLADNAFYEGFGLKSKNLKYLDLRGNYIKELPESFSHLISLETLLLGTPFNYLEKKALFQNGNWLQFLPKKFGELVFLRELCIEENRLLELPEDIGNLIHLKTLYLASNIISYLPSSFTKLTSLERLQLSNNRLKRLPDDFGVFKSLTELYLDFNKLKALPESMKNLVNLKILDLSENRLRQVPHDLISGMTQLQDLNMSDNKFDDPSTVVPFLKRKIHYVEPNLARRNNWRGRNNAPSSSQQVFAEEQKLAPTPDLERRNSCNSDSVEDPDTSDCEEDWQSSVIESCSSSSFSEKVLVHEDTEEDWDSEVHQALPTSDFETGQFDLDNEEPTRPRIFIPEPVQFDSFGNYTNLDIECLQSTLFVHHEPSISRHLYDPVPVVAGQFDTDEESESVRNCGHLQDDLATV